MFPDTTTFKILTILETVPVITSFPFMKKKYLNQAIYLIKITINFNQAILALPALLTFNITAPITNVHIIQYLALHMEVRAFMTTCVHTQKKKNLSRYIVEVRATHLGLPQCFRSAAMAQISLLTRANSLDHSCSRDYQHSSQYFALSHRPAMLHALLIMPQLIATRVKNA